MSAKRGRPPIDHPREKGYRIRMNKEEWEKLNYISNLTGLKKSEILRNFINNYYKEFMS